ncbi:putative fimbrial chaperone YadV [Pseudomonas fluorescens]|uniref:fimbrial biogenesis chaperone n=1 Tax=Pseudomonas fluorescens TaxID=294 RepID=UPI001258360B|nr:fimbria/pilus periplasmic chaperone [Pseudomonas fluorescens]VVP32062.1 putative fimbrial chaperone YadV [Pseudomonas fluorescens]
MKWTALWFTIVMMGSLGGIDQPAWAGVVITGTRLVYPEGKNEISVKLNNNGKHPALVQVWVDEGNRDVGPADTKAPFVLSPPVFRIEPDKGQTVRIISTGAEWPKGKESIFWFNLLEVPPQVGSEQGTSHLQMAFRTRIKLFFRPLSLSVGAHTAAEQLEWNVVNRGNDAVLNALNPTGYYITLMTVNVVGGQKRFGEFSGMIGPGETASFVLPGET